MILDGKLTTQRRAAWSTDPAVERILSLLCAELCADVVALFVFTESRSEVRGLAGDGSPWGLALGAARELIGVPTLDALLPVDERLGDVGGSISVPLPAGGRRPAGLVCALRAEPEPEWDEHDERLAAVLTRLAGDALAPDAERLRGRESISSLLSEDRLEMVFQPVFELGAGTLFAYEALARFPGEPDRAPAEWFAVADDVGMGIELELAAIRAALGRLDDLPPGVLLSLNISPAAAIVPEFAERIEPVADRVIIELTERVSIEDYAPLASVLQRLRARGAKLAIDDVGAGYASLRHILNLAPDIVKLDLSLTRNIVSDAPRRALASALVDFTEGTGATIAAEGIESELEFALLRDLGVDHGQGFYLGCPGALVGSLQ